jgi:CheY-like chemotaxis protein
MRKIMKAIIDYWSTLSWLANLMTIGLGLITLSGLIIGLKKWLSKTNTSRQPHADMSSFISSITEKLPDIKSKKIVIVDDQPENYPISYLQRSGFNITSITSVSLSNFKHLLDYDLIILDVTNIVEEDMKRGGLELMKRIKSENPQKPVISASSKTYDPTLTDFFKLSNKQIQTPINEQKIERVIIETLQESYSPTSTAKSIDSFLTGKGLTQKQKSKILNAGFNYLEKNITEESLLVRCTKTTHAIDAHKYKDMLNKLSTSL